MLEKMIERVKTLTGIKKIDILEKTLDMWKKRELSIFGKILIIKTLAISKITFLQLNLIPPNDII